MTGFLKSKQLQAANFLVTGMKSKDVAHEVGVTPETISHWKNDSQFEAYINMLKREMMNMSLDGMRNLACEAVSTIGYLVKEGESEMVRLKACEVVLKHVGMTDLHSGHWGWEVGSMSAENLEKIKESDSSSNISNMLDSCSSGIL